MLIGFYLELPPNPWNIWPLEEKLFARVRCIRKPWLAVLEAVRQGSFTHTLGDEWIVRIHVKEIDQKEAARIRKTSVGFGVYEWMIESIMAHGKIEYRPRKKTWSVLRRVRRRT
jgi:hypothetical protein